MEKTTDFEALVNVLEKSQEKDFVYTNKSSTDRYKERLESYKLDKKKSEETQKV